MSTETRPGFRIMRDLFGDVYRWLGLGLIRVDNGDIFMVISMW